MKKSMIRLPLTMGLLVCLLGGGVCDLPQMLAPCFSQQVEAAGQADIREIAGSWHEEGGLDARTLTINGDGTYELAYRGGGTSYGLVKVAWEQHPDGTYSPWYNFYASDGTFWESFAKENAGEGMGLLKN